MNMGFDEKEFLTEMDRLREEQFLGQLKSYEKHIAPMMRQKGYHRIDQVERTVTFTFGQITFSRSRWRKGQKTCYPVDEWLGLKPYMRYSLELLLHMAKLASKMSYREVCRTIRDTYRLYVTKDAVLKAVKLASKLITEKEKYRFLLEEEPEKIQTEYLYLEGDGVLVKTTSSGDKRHNTDLAHFLIHTGSKKIGNNRHILQNKHEIVHTDYEKAREELLDYLYNHFDISEQTVLITNSDNGKGYTRRTFEEIKKSLGIQHHEHFWDAYHLHEKVNQFLKNYPSLLKELLFEAIQTHNKSLMTTVFDTVESLIVSDEELDYYQDFRGKLVRRFKETKPPKMRGLSSSGIGVMESQHRKMTYRMKHRGMYWSFEGACAMAKMILLERIDQLDDLFLGDWKKQYSLYKEKALSAGHAKRRIKSPPIIRTYKSGHKNGRWRTNAK